MALIDDILKQIPDKKDLRLIKQRINQRLNPTLIVLLQEIRLFNLLTSTMWKSIVELKRALNGEIVLSPELDEMNRQIYNGQLPSLWRFHAPQTKKTLGNWMEHFRRRNQQYENWLQDGRFTSLC